MSAHRKVPRRKLKAKVGLLCEGHYEVCSSLQLGEGGMLIFTQQKLSVGQLILVTFRLPEGAHLVVRSEVLYNQKEQLYGIGFQNLDLPAKRAVRNFVSSSAR